MTFGCAAPSPAEPPWGRHACLAGRNQQLGGRHAAGPSFGRRGFAAKPAAAEAAPAPSVPLGFAGGKYRLEDFPPERIRNFGIIAHVDHGAAFEAA